MTTTHAFATNSAAYALAVEDLSTNDRAILDGFLIQSLTFDVPVDVWARAVDAARDFVTTRVGEAS